MPYDIEIVVANSNTMNNQEQFADLIQMVIPGCTRSEVMPFVCKPTEGTFCILRDRQNHKVMAYNYFHASWCHTPFRKRKLPVVFYGSCYKHPELRGQNVIWKLGSAFARSLLGRFWTLKPFVGVMTSSNPRVADSFLKLFPEAYLSMEGSPCSDEVASFSTDYFKKNLGIEIPQDTAPYFGHPFTKSECEITALWHKRYNSRNHEMNEMFLRNRIIRREGDRYFLSRRVLPFVGYYRPEVAIKKALIPKLSKMRAASFI